MPTCNHILKPGQMNNTWPTNCPLWQGGEFTFRYSLTSHKKFDPGKSYRFKQEVVSPEFADIKILPENIILTGFHINKDKTLTIRLFEVAGKEGIGKLKWEGVKEAYLIDLCEKRKEKLPVSKEEILFPYSAYKLTNIRIAL